MSFVVRAPIAVAHRTAVVPRRTTDRPARAHTVATRKARKSTMARAEASASAGTGADVVFALDFDGVVCDSEPESSISGWKHGLDLWPEVFGPASAEQGRVLDGLKRVRPVVETGFENTLLARALLEKIHTADDIIADWGGLMPGLMERWNCDRGEMVAGYGKIRDDWMAADLNGWLAPNLVYPGVAEACIAAETSTKCDVFIVTTKQARFAQAIMEGKGDLVIPDERVFSQTVSGLPKTDVLADLQAHARDDAVRLVFVEDKLSTLEKVCKVGAGLERWELFLVDWGYNTEAERARAEADPRITVINVDQFVGMLSTSAAGGK